MKFDFFTFSFIIIIIMFSITKRKFCEQMKRKTRRMFIRRVTEVEERIRRTCLKEFSTLLSKEFSAIPSSTSCHVMACSFKDSALLPTMFQLNINWLFFNSHVQGMTLFHSRRSKFRDMKELCLEKT